MQNHGMVSSGCCSADVRDFLGIVFFSSFGTEAELPASRQPFDRSLQSCESNPLPGTFLKNHQRAHRQGWRFGPQNERSFKRHKCSSVLRNDARRVVSNRTSCRNRSAVDEGGLRSRPNVLRHGSSPVQMGHRLSAVRRRAQHSRHRNPFRREKPEPEMNIARPVARQSRGRIISADQCFASSACQATSSAPIKPRFSARW